jgi:serine/threonine protein kinase
MRDLRHDNLNAFIGACTDPPNICIVTEYCTRGSLKDILENEDVKLDNMFIASLVGDILRGMIYLHDSPVRFHGALHSANCLVDSRWVVKLADFGLREFKRGAEQPGIKDPAKVREKCYSEFTHKGNTSPGNQRIPIGPSGNLKFKCPHFRTNIFAASFCQNLHRAGSEVYSIFAKLISNVISIIIFHRLKHIFG